MPVENKHLYIISGLGADFEVFEKLKFNLPYTFLPWIEEQKGESLNSYARRMAKSIDHPNPIILGLSFGGIIAHEISTFREVEHLILISTVASSAELPFYYKWAGRLKLPYLLPSNLLHRNNALLNYMFGMNTSEEKLVLDKIMRSNRVSHFRWALDRISHWRSDVPAVPHSRIHGINDRIFPKRYLKEDCEMVNGGHFCVFGDYAEVQEKLDYLLSSTFEDRGSN